MLSGSLLILTPPGYYHNEDPEVIFSNLSYRGVLPRPCSSWSSDQLEHISIILSRIVTQIEEEMSCGPLMAVKQFNFIFNYNWKVSCLSQLSHVYTHVCTSSRHDGTRPYSSVSFGIIISQNFNLVMEATMLQFLYRKV